MAMVIVGLLKDAHQARGVIRALDDAGFSGDDIDLSGGLLSQLVTRGVPDEDAQAFAEAAELMSAHGAVEGRIYQDPRRRGYTGPERRAL